MKAALTLNVFTDPQCPFAYSAEPTRLRLTWLYGQQINWRTAMIVLSGYDSEVSHLTPEQVAHYADGIRERYGMPIDFTVKPRNPQTVAAAEAYIAVQHHTNADAFLRNLRVASMSGQLIDEQAIIERAATQAGINVAQLRKWLAEPELHERLRADAERARNPTNKGLIFEHKLSTTSTGRTRYSAPSYQFIVDDSVVAELPGFWPLEAYEAIIGNVAPVMTRRANPTSVTEILEWAKTPLATIEVATVYGKDVEATRTELKQSAKFDPVGQDGFWS